MSISLTLKKWTEDNVFSVTVDLFHTRDILSSRGFFMGDGDIVKSTNSGNIYKANGDGYLEENEDLSAQNNLVLADINLTYLRNATGSLVFEFTSFTDVDLTEHLLESDAQINKKLEGDRPLKFEVSSVELIINKNDDLATEFTVSNLATYLYGIEFETRSGEKFNGVINKEDIIYDPVAETWAITSVDWFKYHYDILANFEMTTNYTSTSDFLSKIFNSTPTTGKVKIIQSINNKIGYADTWSSSNGEGNIIASGLVSLQHMLDECRKYFTAYIFIDSNYALNFIPMWQYKNATAVAIDNFILDESYEVIPFVSRPYDAIITNLQKATWSVGDVPKKVWGLLKLVKGEFVNEYISNRESLDAKIKDLEVLDLRQKLQGNDNSTALIENLGTYRFFEIPNEGNILTPLDPLKKYKFLLKPGKSVKCLTMGVELDLMDKVSIESADYQVAEINSSADSEDTASKILELTLRSVV